MPVIEHDVHAKTKIDMGTYRNGCFSDRPKVLPITYIVKNGYRHDGTIILEHYINPMSRECRYDQSLNDLGCVGCTEQGKGEAYAHAVQQGGK